MKLFNKELSKELPKDTSWKKAVHEGVKLLVKKGFATQKLEDAILKSTKENGAYYVLEKGVALLHAPIGPYALKTGTSLIFLSDNIQFNNEDKWAKIIITLSAVDSTSHMEAIQEFGRIFTDKINKEKLYSAKNLKEFYEFYEHMEGGE